MTVIDTQEGRLIQQVKTDTALSKILCMGKHGKVIVVSKDHNLLTVDIKTGKTCSTISPNRPSMEIKVTRVAKDNTNFKRSKVCVLWKGADPSNSSIGVFDPQTECIVAHKTVAVDYQHVTCLHYVGSRLVLSCGKNVTVMDSSLQVLLEHRTKGDVRFCQLTPDGAYVAYVYGKKQVRVSTRAVFNQDRGYNAYHKLLTTVTIVLRVMAGLFRKFIWVIQFQQLHFILDCCSICFAFIATRMRSSIIR